MVTGIEGQRRTARRAERGRLLVVLVLALALSSMGNPKQVEAKCSNAAARALAADADRATRWNWGWGGLFAGSALAHGGLALLADDDNARVALWTGAFKSSAGVINQLIFPIRIYGPRGECENLRSQLVHVAEIERKRRDWLAHATTIGVSVSSFTFVQYMTGDLRLSLTGAIVGTIVGELTIFTTPNRVRSEGFALESLSLVPIIDGEQTGVVLGARF